MFYLILNCLVWTCRFSIVVLSSLENMIFKNLLEDIVFRNVLGQKKPGLSAVNHQGRGDRGDTQDNNENNNDTMLSVLAVRTKDKSWENWGYFRNGNDLRWPSNSSQNKQSNKRGDLHFEGLAVGLICKRHISKDSTNQDHKQQGRIKQSILNTLEHWCQMKLAKQ